MKYNELYNLDELIESDIEFNILTAEYFDDIEIQDTDMDILYAIDDELIANEIYNTHYLSNISLLESRAMKFKRIINEL